MTKKFECPTYDENCPYYENGYCTLEEPTECDDFCAEIDDDYDDDLMEMGYNS